MEFNLTNEEIVYLYTQIKDYKEAIDKQYNKDLPFMQKHIALYEDFLKDQEDNNKIKDLVRMHKEILNDILPSNLENKLEFLGHLLEKFAPIYEMIEESDPDFVAQVDKSLISYPDKLKEISEDIKNKYYGEQDNI